VQAAGVETTGAYRMLRMMLLFSNATRGMSTISGVVADEELLPESAVCGIQGEFVGDWR
jgi:hypothetical protein